MTFGRRVEQFDANYSIPRPADEPDLDSAQAATRVLKDLARGSTLLLSSAVAGYLLFLSGQMLELDSRQMTMVLVGSVIVSLVGPWESFYLAYPYFNRSQRLANGAPCWATLSDLKVRGLAHSTRKLRPRGAVRLGHLGSPLNPLSCDLILGPKQLLGHTAIFGPSDSGKSASFFMNFLRDWSQCGSTVVLDLKGELCAHTAHHYDHVYRLDLAHPELSNLWNPLPRCLQNPELARAIAALVAGCEPENLCGSARPHYSRPGETALLTALCLHLPAIALNPTLGMIGEFLARSDRRKLHAELSHSPAREAQLEWRNFRKMAGEKQGAVIGALVDKLSPLRSPQAISILKTATAEELERGAREIDLGALSQPRTAIFVVLSQSEASQYRILLELIFSLATIERQAATREIATPLLIALDDAGHIAFPRLSDKLKVGTFCRTAYLLGFDDVSQMKRSFLDPGEARVAGFKNQIFLPGIDPETGAYASSLLSSTTALSHPSDDAPGINKDAERIAQNRRRQAPELRRLVKHRQGIAIIENTAPILFRFLPRADTGNLALPPAQAIAPAQTLAEAIQARRQLNQRVKPKAVPLQLPLPALRSGESAVTSGSEPKPKSTQWRRINLSDFAGKGKVSGEE